MPEADEWFLHGSGSSDSQQGYCVCITCRLMLRKPSAGAWNVWLMGRQNTEGEPC